MAGPANIAARINEARARGCGMVLVLTGGTPGRFVTDGKVDIRKWIEALRRLV